MKGSYMITQSHSTSSSTNFDFNLSPVQLSHRFATLDPLTGNWDVRDNYQQRFEIRGRGIATIKHVYERLKQLEEITSSDYSYYLMSGSFSCLQDYQKNVVLKVRCEVAQHKRYVQAIGEKIKNRLVDRWQWLINLPVIGYLFAAIVTQIKGAFTRNLKVLVQVLENKHKVLCRLEEKLETAIHLKKLFGEDKIIKKAFRDYDKKMSEELLYELRQSHPEERRTFLLLRGDPQNIEGFILSKLDKHDGARVEHVPFTARRINSTAYVYIRPQSEQNGVGGVDTLPTLKALQRYLNNLQKP